MNKLVSICVPTYNRPEMLAEALESCVTQDYSPIEIVIGDDSTSDSSEPIAERYRAARDWSISYRRNDPSLGQNDNVNELFDRSTGDMLVLLHDDDRLLPGAITALVSAFTNHATVQVAFGQQAIISVDGQRDDEATTALNVEFFRSGPSRVLPNALVTALLQQFPNDAYMINRELAARVRYRPKDQIGNHCDVEFALRVCERIEADAVFYVDRLIAEYRRHDTSISQSAENRQPPNPVPGRTLFATIGSLSLHERHEYARSRIYSRFTDRVLKGFALNGARGEAIRLFLSKNYGWKRRVSSKGIYHLALIAFPALDAVRRYS